MKTSKRISDETIKSILGWIFIGLIAFLFFANSVGFAMALGTIFFLVPLSLPFVFLIIGTRKDPKPVSFVNASHQPVRGRRQLLIGDDYQPIGMSRSSFWDNDDSSSDSYSSDSSSGSCFDDSSSIISSSNDLSHDMLYDPSYSYLECNIFHHDDN